MVKRREAHPRKHLQDTSTLSQLYTTLPPHVKRDVEAVGVQSWGGQEYDLMQDIVQETVVRTFIQIKKAELGEGLPIISAHHFSKRVARNYLLDLVRKDSRLLRPSCDPVLQESMMTAKYIDKSLDDVLDDIENDTLFTRIAHVIARLPSKRQRALLIDLALYTDFDEPPGPLRRALAGENIYLEPYRNSLPAHTTQQEKQRHSSHLSQAYKHVKEDVRASLQASRSA